MLQVPEGMGLIPQKQDSREILVTDSSKSSLFGPNNDIHGRGVENHMRILQQVENKSRSGEEQKVQAEGNSEGNSEGNREKLFSPEYRADSREILVSDATPQHQ